MKFRKINIKSVAYWTICSILGIAAFLMLSALIVRLSGNSPVDSSLTTEITKSTNEKNIQISILNSCGVKSLAAKTKNYLKSRGFDVLEIGNAKKTLEKTIIIDRLGDLESARKVANAIGVNLEKVESVVDSSLCLRATVILGKDFNTLKPFLN